MQVLFDGGGVLLEHWRSLLFLTGAVLGYGGLGVSFFPRAASDRKWIAFPLCIGTGLILLTLLTYVLFLASLVWRDVIMPGAYAILLGGAVLLARNLRRGVNWTTVGWSLLALLLLTMRLAFVSGLVLPPYSDSPTHYLIVLNLLEPASRPDALYVFQNVFQNYYHFGVHCLTAWAELVSGETSPLMLAIIGQFFLSAAPFSAFALAGILAEQGASTARNSAAWAAGLLTAFGWWMPAFGANWGKYPTIAGLAILPVPLAYLYAWRGTKPGVALLIVTGLLLAGTVLLQSRTSLLLGLAALAFWIAALASRRLPRVRWMLIIGAVLLTLGMLYWGWTHPDLSGFYTSNWLLLIALIVLLVPGYIAYPEQVLAILLALAGLALLAGLQAPSFLSNYSFQLLDRPFVQMGLYLPLALLGGLGIAGLTRRLSATGRLAWAPVAVLALLIVAGAWNLRTFYPDRCCEYAGQDDLRAFDWLQQHASSQAEVVVAGLRTSTRLIETDAGVWVYAMTGLDTAKRSFNASLDDAGFIASVCQGRREVYLYFGGGPMSFRPPTMPAMSPAYDVVFSSGNTGIVQVQWCGR